MTAGDLLNTKGGASSSRDKGGDGEFNHVEDSEAVTPVARETLNSTWMIFSSSS